MTVWYVYFDEKKTDIFNSFESALKASNDYLKFCFALEDYEKYSFDLYEQANETEEEIFVRDYKGHNIIQIEKDEFNDRSEPITEDDIAFVKGKAEDAVIDLLFTNLHNKDIDEMSRIFVDHFIGKCKEHSVIVEKGKLFMEDNNENSI